MDEIAEFGIAAHCHLQGRRGHRQSQRRTRPSEDATPYQWLRRLVDNLLEGDNPEEFLEHTKLELFQDQVFCFTPEGQADRPAARLDADRLRLCRAHQYRP